MLLLELGEEPVRHRVVEGAEVLGLGLVGALGLLPRAEPQAGLQEVAVRAAGEGLDDARGRPLAREAQPGTRLPCPGHVHDAVPGCEARVPSGALLLERAHQEAVGLGEVAGDAGLSARDQGQVALDAVEGLGRVLGMRAAEGRGAGRCEAREVAGVDAASEGGFERLQQERGRDALAARGRVEARVGQHQALLGGSHGLEEQQPLGFLAVARGAEVRGEGLALVVEQQRVGPHQAGERALDEAGDEHDAEAQAAGGVDRAHEDAAVAELALAVALGGQQLADAGQELLAARGRSVLRQGTQHALQALAREGASLDPGVEEGERRVEERAPRAGRGNGREVACRGGRSAGSGCRRGGGRGRRRTRGPRGLSSSVPGGTARPRGRPRCRPGPRGGPSGRG